MIVESEVKEKRAEMTAFFAGYSGEVRFDEPMAPYTSLKIGGVASAMIFPESPEAVSDWVKKMREAEVPYFVLGAGSNLLISEHGIAGVVIQLSHMNQGVLTGWETFYAEAGLSYPRLSTYAEKQGLSGLEFASGIPGTVGGAVAMNAGILGEETASVLKEITMVTAVGEIVTLPREAIGFSYRSAGLPDGAVIVSAEFRLQKADVREIEKKRISLLKKRRETQPLSYPNAGSIFKNPRLGGSAGSLIEAVGLKGHQIGGAQISERHGNFIINLGGATALDVSALIQFAKEKVFAEKGILLETEIKMIGGE
jgi:UDP-N-acetylmuramate dehydrogenase